MSNHESEHDSGAFPSPDKAADVPTESGKSAPVPRSSARRSRPAASIGKNPPAMMSPIEQAEALRATLRAALAQTNQLIVSLRRQRKQNRLMKSTLESLKDLQRVAG